MLLDCGGEPIRSVAFGGNNTAGPINVSTAINAHGGPHGRLDFESETFVLSSDFGQYNASHAAAVRAKGGDAGGGSEVLVCHGTMDPCSQTELAFALGRNNGGENAILFDDPRRFTGAHGGFLHDDVHPTLESTNPKQLIAFSCKDHGADAAQDVAPTMRAMGHSGSHANAGGQLAVCVTGDVTHTLKAEGFDASEDGTGRGQPIVFDTTQITSPANYSRPSPGGPRHPLAAGAHAPAVAFQVSQPVRSQVRRLTPLECERLQGFPDSYTAIPWKGKPASECPDGPRYKALGNSMNAAVMDWIGRRIAMVEAEEQMLDGLLDALSEKPVSLFDL